MLDHNLIAKLANELEPLPSNCLRLAEIGAQEDPDLDEAIRIVSYDPVLTGKVLNVANSAMFSHEREIGCVKEAVVRLGPALILSVAVGACARRAMMDPIPAYELERGALWKHCAGAAVAASVIQEMGRSVTHYSFTASLLHDIGKPILGRLLTRELRQYCLSAEEFGKETADAECEILSFHHGEVGGVIAQHWGLPDRLVRAISNHHRPDPHDEADVHAVQLADAVMRKLEGEATEPESRQATIQNSLEKLGLNQREFAKVCERTAVRLESDPQVFG